MTKSETVPPHSGDSGGRRTRAGRIAAIGLLLALAPGRLPAAELRVQGLGWLDNRAAQQTLRLLLGRQAAGPLDASAIEDAALVLFSDLNDQGYLEPELTAEVTRTDGRIIRYALDAKLEKALPRPLAATAVTFHVRPGQRFVLQEVGFTGLAGISTATARSFFLGEKTLFSLDSRQVYSPGRLNRSISNLQEALRRLGYAEVSVKAADLRVNPANGRVKVAIQVVPGPQWRVSALGFDVKGGGVVPPELAADRLDQPWSELWRQDAATEIRRWYYKHGYPDVRVRLAAKAAPEADGYRAATVTARVTPGPQVRVGAVRFTGNERTRESVLRPLVAARPGDLFNPVQFDDGRSRLARLGVFSGIELHTIPAGAGTRDAVYALTEGRRQELNLLAGYGSYVQFRGGIEWRRYNLFGRAHSSMLQLVQSVKSTKGEYSYTVPELFGSSVDGSARLFGLRRDELAFVREEYGANVSLLWPLPRLGMSATTGYTFKHLRNMDNELATQLTDLRRNNAASLEAGLTRDRRDNPLQPHHGYKVAVQVEAASRALGGQVDYQQFQVNASYHTGAGPGRWLHLGLAHAVVATLGSPDDTQLPVNVRFFPGGENSIRGYRSGEASPRSATGQFIGAKSFTLLSVELEQALTKKWSLVAFSDSLGTAVRLADYPFDERLYSVGIGVRYQTIVGPIRLEYGHNLNPRPLDPSGTLQVSVGFPF
jgi:outer membrane protein assembly complex protein YaeT